MNMIDTETAEEMDNRYVFLVYYITAIWRINVSYINTRDTQNTVPVLYRYLPMHLFPILIHFLNQYDLK